MSDKHNVQEIFDLGVRAFVRQDIELSVEKFSEVIRLALEFGLAYVSRGSAYLRQERVREALADFSRAIEIDPGYARAHHLRGLAHDRLGDAESARRDFDKAISIDPEYGAAYYSRSMVQSKLGHEDEAFEDIQMYTVLTQKNLFELAEENNIWQSHQLALEESETGVADVMDR